MSDFSFLLIFKWSACLAFLDCVNFASLMNDGFLKQLSLTKKDSKNCWKPFMKILRSQYD